MTDKQLFQLCQRYGKEARLARNKFVALLPEVERRRLHRKKGFGSIFEFAAKLGGVSKNVVMEVIRVDYKLKEMPRIRKKIADVGLSKVKIIVNVATKQTEKEWARDLTNMTKSALETKARDARNSHPGVEIPNTTQEVIFDNKEDFSIKLTSKTIQKLKSLKVNMKKGTTWDDVFFKMLKNTRVKKQRARNLKAECKEVCEIPNCNKPAVEIHHKDRWSITGKHENLQSLCHPHHELEHQTDSTVDKKFRKYLMQPALL